MSLRDKRLPPGNSKIPQRIHTLGEMLKQEMLGLDVWQRPQTLKSLDLTPTVVFLIEE
jgi:hypothetical protein